MKSTVIDQAQSRDLFRQLSEAFVDHPSIVREICVCEDERPTALATPVPSLPKRDSSELAMVEVTVRLRVPRVLIPALRIQ